MLTSEGENPIAGGGHYREVLTVGAVGTFAVGGCCHGCPRSRRVTLLSTCACPPTTTVLTWLPKAWITRSASARGVARHRSLRAAGSTPHHVLKHTLLRSYRADEWSLWFQAAGLPADTLVPRSIIFDSSLAMMEAALQGIGVALAPAMMFFAATGERCDRQPFDVGISTGSYWLTRLQSRAETPAMLAFKGGCVKA
ncbi:lysR substrate binding domain-containing protein [Ditylenchus destructor]|nr:lysR substrate binding domain-containing protein [Ditylenchus destructor]